MKRMPTLLRRDADNAHISSPVPGYPASKLSTSKHMNHLHRTINGANTLVYTCAESNSRRPCLRLSLLVCRRPYRHSGGLSHTVSPVTWL